MCYTWKYYFDNISSDQPVAILKNPRNITVLKVVETRDSHVSIPAFDFIRSFGVSYHDEAKLSEELPTDSTDEILRKRLIVGCKIIERNYHNQVEQIKSYIM